MRESLIISVSILQEDQLVRGLGILTGMLVLVAVLVGGATLWMGPGLANLAFIDPNREASYTLVDFVRLEPAGALEARYHQPLAGLLASEGARLASRYRQLYLLEGRRADEWQQLSLVRLPRAQDLAQIMTSGPYRLINRSVTDIATLKLGSYEPAADQWRRGLVVWRASSATDPFVMVRERLAATQGRIVWDSQVEVFEGDSRWNRVLIADFIDMQTALAWLRSREMETERAILNGNVADLSLAVYESFSRQ